MSDQDQAPQAIHLHGTKSVRLDALKQHPKNYLYHPDDEIAELITSIKEHGLYRPVVIANDSTILAGHGVTLALMKMGLEYVSVVEMPYAHDDSRALKLLIGDNEIGHMAEIDDRLLVETLNDLKKEVNDLSGTGFDNLKLAARAFVTRGASELKDREAAADWVDMPEYAESSPRLKVVVFFPSQEYRDQFGELLGVDMSKVGISGLKQVLWWPHRAVNDLKSVVFTDGEAKIAPPPAPTNSDEGRGDLVESKEWNSDLSPKAAETVVVMDEVHMTIDDTVEQAEVPYGWQDKALELFSQSPTGQRTEFTDEPQDEA